MRGAERRLFMRERTPAWANLVLIRVLYNTSRLLGAAWHVDHVVPLVHPHVCGLHCSDNLRVIRCLENINKSNHQWPDKPSYQNDLSLESCTAYQYELSL